MGTVIHFCKYRVLIHRRILMNYMVCEDCQLSLFQTYKLNFSDLYPTILSHDNMVPAYLQDMKFLKRGWCCGVPKSRARHISRETMSYDAGISLDEVQKHQCI